MGLDNGIILKVANKKDYEAAYNTFRHEDWYNENECEVAYWRKCWGVRNAFLTAVENPKENDGEYPITLDNIDLFIRLHKYFLTEKTWSKEANSIWDWDKDTKIREAVNHRGLRDLKRWLRDHPDDEAYFYDSY